MATITSTTDISAEDVLEFLREIEDQNFTHQDPYKILPGMYGLSLIEALVDSPVSKLHINFNVPTRYPCELKTEIETTDAVAKFRVLNSDVALCSGQIEFDSKDDPELNPHRFFSTYRIGGGLLRYAASRFREGETGIYLAQSMEFRRGVNPLGGELRFGEITGDRKRRVIPVEYVLGDDILAKGVTGARPIDEKVLEKMLRKVE